MKLLSDFDGVWTDPAQEALAQGEILERRLMDGIEITRRPEAAEWVRAARSAAAREPGRFGWVSNGRLSAFGDEDPFTAHSALLHYLEVVHDGDAWARELRDLAIAAGGQDLDAFGGQCHAAAVEQVVRTRGPGILPAAAAAGRDLLARGVEIVLVSNSPPDKLLRWLEHAAVPATRHPVRTPGAVRARGSAGKFELGPLRRERLELGEVVIDVDRPAYEAILMDERPDAVVGDVFSLDLALPLALRRTDPAWSRVRLFWLIQPYAPDRLRRAVREHAPEVEFAHGFGDVATALGREPQGRVS